MREITGAESDVLRLLNPSSIAVVGASSKPYTISWWPGQLPRQYGFGGDLFLVNPRRSEIDGVRTYASVLDLPVVPDAVVVALGAGDTPAAVAECAAAGVGSVVLPAQGFGELGEEGRAAEGDMLESARAAGMRIVGPNTDGVANLRTGAVLSIQPILGQGIRPGPVAVVTQSGATAGSLISRLAVEGIGCGIYASAGNEVDLGYADYLSVAIQDPETKIVLSFLESLRKPEDFEQVAAHAAELDKPIALIKVGRSQQGARRAAAHTGSMAGEDALYTALFKKYGVIRVDELADLVAIGKYFLGVGTPASRGVGIFSVSGGQAGAVADQAVTEGLEVPALSPDAEAALDAALPVGGAFNPCDTTGEIARDPVLASRVYSAFASDPLGAVIYARKTLSGTLGVQAAEPLVEASRRPGAAPLVCYAFDAALPEDERGAFAAGGVPVFSSMHDICTAVGALHGRGARVGRVVVPDPSRPRVSGAGELRPLPDAAAKELLHSVGCPLPAERIVQSRDEALAAAADMTFPLVVKVADDRVTHKTEAGGVVVGVTSTAELEDAYLTVVENVTKHLDGQPPAGVLVQEQVPPGVEMIVGARVDPRLGSFVLLGMGGIWTEILGDFTLRRAPLDEQDVHDMLAELQGRALLEGFRGSPPADVPALVDVVLAVSRLVSRPDGRIAELDLNPVIVGTLGAGAQIADVLVIEEQHV